MITRNEVDCLVSKDSLAKRGIIFNPGIKPLSPIQEVVALSPTQSRNQHLKQVREFLTQGHFAVGSWLIRESTQEGFVTVSWLILKEDPKTNKKVLDYKNCRFCYSDGKWQEWNDQPSAETGKLTETPKGLTPLDKMTIGSHCQELITLIKSKTVKRKVNGTVKEVLKYPEHLWILPNPHLGQLTENQNYIHYGMNVEYANIPGERHLVVGASEIVYNNPFQLLGKLYQELRILAEAKIPVDLDKIEPLALIRLQQISAFIHEYFGKEADKALLVASLEKPYAERNINDRLYACLAQWIEKDLAFSNLCCPILARPMLTPDLEPYVINDSGQVFSKDSLFNDDSLLRFQNCPFTNKPIISNPYALPGYTQLAEKTMGAFITIVKRVFFQDFSMIALPGFSSPSPSSSSSSSPFSSVSSNSVSNHSLFTPKRTQVDLMEVEDIEKPNEEISEVDSSMVLN